MVVSRYREKYRQPRDPEGFKHNLRVVARLSMPEEIYKFNFNNKSIFIL